MSHIASYLVDRSDGTTREIALYNLGDYPPDALLFQLSDGRYASPYLAPLGDGVGDTGVLVQASDGSWWRVRHQSPEDEGAV